MSDDSTAQLAFQLKEGKTRPLIEFRSAFTTIAGVCTVKEASERSLQFCLSAAEGGSCELVPPLIPSSFTFTMKSFTQERENVLLAALAELTAELGRPFQTNILEQVADISFCGGGLLPIGPRYRSRF